MKEVEEQKSWEILEALIKKADRRQVKKYFDNLTSDEIVLLVSHLSKQDQVKLVSFLSSANAAHLISEIPEFQAKDILGRMETSGAAAVIDQLKSNEQVDLISEFEEEDATAIMAEMQPEEVEKVKKLIQYDSETAGGLMVTEFLAFDERMTVRDVVRHLREKSEEYKHYNVQYIYVTALNKFVGVIQIRDLLLNKPNELLSTIAIKNAQTVNVGDSLEQLIHFFDTYDFYGVPVLGKDKKLEGIVMRKDIRKEETELANKELLETQGIVGGEELRTMPILLRSKRRLSWLSVNILLNIGAASIIALYQDTLSAVIALAVFLPIISDMSGCSGNQAVAVSLRELALGVVKPFELRRVWFQEISVGIINGLALGGLLGLVAWLWQGNFYLGLVVGAALGLNTILAVSIGGTVPLLLKKMKLDPALASGPILTTVTDMFGFFLTLSFASSAMSHLGVI
ncbi:MAG: magnesium transporter [Cyclobacteriaceae bacterium]